MAVRRITADRRELIRQLSDILYNFLPLTSHAKNTVTFRSIFAESGVARYLEGDIKRKALQSAWKEVLRRHPRLPHALIRKIVPAAIEYRRHKRDPLRREELDALIGCLEKLGINLSGELRRIELDETMPEIR